MNTYVITFQALNSKKEKITCSAFVHSETLFLAVHSFEDKNRGRGYAITSVSELFDDELTAKNSLKKNINFWFNECGLSKSEVINEVINWKNFAYTIKELEEAKNEAIRELRS
ncbi:TPA: hypothetical protein IEO78_004199 [Escherichia coli]|uniref:Uncharacterized protein n=1 Tax=Salmonella muenchen TaxID=596 RepID=A0A5W3IUN7_SALMU|nr:hypothetical protein [Salmonella enterica subsp. enterica serovar Muenchen]EDC5432998.1 hypothetical protein [Salmonella enterica]EDL8671123.1 hypothetical protein [Salmonella enterica subsp. enterica serovar Infantis]MCO0321920.1 hypothetical protein [Escherichia coli]HBM3160025.1 hypothetical protein [Klebsiella michiganensis]